MAHKHSVRDTGAHFLIDQFTRHIKNDSANKTTIVQYDHNSERLTFEIPLYVDGHAMTLCDLIEIHYINISTDGNSQNPGTYEVNDIKAEGENAVFTWLISQECTQLAGSLNFFIVFKCTENGVTVYRWGTEIYKNLPISAGMDNGEAVLTEYPDILAQWKAQLFSASDTAVLNVATAEANALAAIEAAGEAKKQAVLDSIPDEYEVMGQNVNANAANIKELANAIKGKLSGSVVRANDVSPMDHNPVVLAHGKNLIPYPYTETTKQVNGITFTDNGDGTITANGTATETTTFKLHNKVPLIGGKTYVMNSNYIVISYKNEVGSAKWLVGTTPFVWNEEYTLVQAYLQISSGATLDNVVIKPQVERGNTVTDYEAWFDPSTVTVTRLGKNLLNNKEKSQTINGITFTVQEDGTVSASGTATADANFVIYKKPPLEVGETYRLNGNPSGAIESKYYMRLVLAWDVVNHTFYDYGTGIEFEVGGTVTAASLTITVKSGVTANGLLFKPMIRHVSCDDSFEPYTEQTANPAADGTVSGMTSLSPCMTILTDTEGVTVECEYNRDTNKVIADILERIEALKNA